MVPYEAAGMEWFYRRAVQDEIDVRNFIQKNYTPYGGDSSFLCGPTQRTLDVRKKFEDLLLQEHANGGALKVDTETVITPTSFGPGYLDKEKDIIVGLQTDEPFKAGLQPFGACAWCAPPARPMATRSPPRLRRSLNTTRPTTTACSPPTPRKSRPPATWGLSPACPTPTAGGASSATTAGWPCTASTG